ncbi:MAG TPA: formate--tetrahydrofolate ligase, partial [Chloroflexota bacterium]
MKSDLEIAQAAKLKPIVELAGELGLRDEEVEPYGRYKAKVNLGVLERLRDRPNGKYIDVTG